MLKLLNVRKVFHVIVVKLEKQFPLSNALPIGVFDLRKQGDELLWEVNTSTFLLIATAIETIGRKLIFC